MSQTNWEGKWDLKPLGESQFGPSPLQELLDLWVKLMALNLGHVEKPKFYYISTKHLDSPLNVYTITMQEGLKVSIFHHKVKDVLLSEAIRNGWEPVDYQEYSKTEEWFELYGKHSLEKLTKDLITRMSK